MKLSVNRGVGMKSILLVAAVVLVPVVAFAAGGGDHEGMGIKDWAWRILNFAILVVLLVKFVGKPLREYLASRKELIEKSIREAQEAKELAKKALAEVEERLKLKDKEIADILASAKSSGEAERDRLTAEGERMAVRIAEQAKTNIDFELKRAKEIIQEEAVQAALQLAEEKIRQQLTKDEQDKLLRESIKLIEGRN
jgi:F-type H+-transporting ATPase subunit b